MRIAETRASYADLPRTNNDLEQLDLSMRVKQELTEKDSVFVQVGYFDSESGDVAQYYNQSSASSTLRVKEGGESLEIGNEFFTLRVPSGKKVFDRPAAAASVPAPFQGWQPAGARWMGGSRFVTDRKVTAMACAVLKNGPACVQYEARYRFAPAQRSNFFAQGVYLNQFLAGNPFQNTLIAFFKASPSHKTAANYGSLFRTIRIYFPHFLFVCDSQITGHMGK